MASEFAPTDDPQKKGRSWPPVGGRETLRGKESRGGRAASSNPHGTGTKTISLPGEGQKIGKSAHKKKKIGGDQKDPRSDRRHVVSVMLCWVGNQRTAQRKKWGEKENA